MNIVFVNATKEWAGVKTWMMALAEFLKQRGHTVSFVCRRNDDLVQVCQERRIPCYPLASFGMDFSPKTILWFMKFFRQERTDVVITNIAKGFRTGGVAAKLMGLAHINRLGAPGDLRQTLKTRLLYTLFADRVFVCSKFLYNHFAEWKCLRTKLRWFHNALAIPEPSPSLHEPVRLAVVAKLSKRKQVDVVLDVLARMTDLSWELHIGGYGEELIPLQKQAQDLQIHERVHFAGKVNSLKFLADKDVGILYSSREPFGYAVIEYMACCCAVIASNVGGIPEIVTPDVDGVLVDPDDSDALEAALRTVLAQPETRRELVRTAYDMVTRRFGVDAIFPQVEAEIESTLAQLRPRRKSHSRHQLFSS